MAVDRLGLEKVVQQSLETAPSKATRIYQSYGPSTASGVSGDPFQCVGLWWQSPIASSTLASILSVRACHLVQAVRRHVIDHHGPLGVNRATASCRLSTLWEPFPGRTLASSPLAANVLEHPGSPWLPTEMGKFRAPVGRLGGHPRG